MKFSKKLFLTACLASAPWSFAWAMDYYVSPNGDDVNNSGTSVNSPWRTPQKAADVAVAGDVIYLSGVFRPDGFMGVMVNFANAGTPDAPIVMKALDQAELNGMWDLSGTDNWICEAGDVNCYALGLKAGAIYVDYPDVPMVTQDDQALRSVRSLGELTEGTYYLDDLGDDDDSNNRLYVNPIGGGNPGNYLLEASQSNQVVLFQAQDQYINLGDVDGELKVTGSFYGIRTLPDSGNHVITNVTLRHFREDAIKFNTRGNTGDVVQGCRISSYGDFGIDAFNTNNQVFKGNFFTEVLPWMSGGAIKLLRGSSDILIEGNTARSLGGRGGEGAFQIQDATNVDIVNNIIADSPSSALEIFGDRSVTSNVRIINNTIFRTGGSAIWLVDYRQPVENVSLYNNIVDNSDATGDFSRALRVDSGTETGFVSDYNDFYRPGSSDLVNWLGTRYGDLASYQGASGQDLNSISENPLFGGVAGGNFVPMAGSPVIDTGFDDPAPPADIDGIARPQGLAVDMGAHEVASSPGGPPPLVIYPNAAGIDVTMGQTVNIRWKGFAAPKVKIHLYDGDDYVMRVTGSANYVDNTGAFPWTIPTGLDPNGKYRIKIISTWYSSVFDYSDNFFTISPGQP